MDRSEQIIAARMVMENDSYALVIKHAISLGKDTDNTACIAGGIAGICDGGSSISDRLLSHRS